jgi:IrrE N-terminal-like domain
VVIQFSEQSAVLTETMDFDDRNAWRPELPQTQSGREFERKALRIRKFAGRSPHISIDPYELARQLNVIVVTLDDLNGVSEEARQQLLKTDVNGWSGGATPVLVDGTRIVVLNPAHSLRRRAATLMEELCHIMLGHTADRLGVANGDADNRDYNANREREAYGVGAAVLLPFVALRSRLERGIEPRLIAREFGVSVALVNYRAKITGLWKLVKIGT